MSLRAADDAVRGVVRARACAPLTKASMRPFGETAALGPMPNVYVIAASGLKRTTACHLERRPCRPSSPGPSNGLAR